MKERNIKRIESAVKELEYIKELLKDDNSEPHSLALDWYGYFADQVQDTYPNIYNEACDYADMMEKENEKVPQEFEVKILWGAYPEKDAELQTYKFNTIAEMEAFKKGISEANGWNDYEIMTEEEYNKRKEFNNQ